MMRSDELSNVVNSKLNNTTITLACFYILTCPSHLKTQLQKMCTNHPRESNLLCKN